MKKIFRKFKKKLKDKGIIKPKLLKKFHIIKTDKALYVVYNCEEYPNVYIERNGKSILKDDIKDESLELMGGKSFSNFVGYCVWTTLCFIKKNDENVIYNLRPEDIRYKRIIKIDKIKKNIKKVGNV